jgi:hypothetical protein
LKTRADTASTRCAKAMKVNELDIHTDSPFLAKYYPALYA